MAAGAQWEASAGAGRARAGRGRWLPSMGSMAGWGQPCDPVVSSMAPTTARHILRALSFNPVALGPGLWESLSFQPREGSDLLLMRNLGLPALPPCILALQLLKKKPPVVSPLCLKSLTRSLLDSLDPPWHRGQAALREAGRQLWPGKEGRFRADLACGRGEVQGPRKQWNSPAC